jgi:quercetin dioxygenase-like cupin family protein
MQSGIVNKPWGREYCAYRNERVAVWVLEIAKGEQTSLHAHPLKSTAFVVLRGTIEKHLLRGPPITLRPMDKINIFRGRFHRQRALTDGVVLLEIEAPDDKRDIVRLEDDYGRAGLPIEEPTDPLTPDCLQWVDALYTTSFAGRVLRVEADPIGIREDEVFVTLRGGLEDGLLPPGEAIDGLSFERVRAKCRVLPNSRFLHVW